MQKLPALGTMLSDTLPVNIRMFSVLALAPTWIVPLRVTWYTVPEAPGVAVTTEVAVVVVRFANDPAEPV